MNAMWPPEPATGMIGTFWPPKSENWNVLEPTTTL
jgi:hypothetical protein